jgi:hypothetical protein
VITSKQILNQLEQYSDTKKVSGHSVIIYENPISSDILEISKSWDEKQEILFKKMIKQGGKFRINGVVINATLPETILTSRGEKDGGTQKTDPLARF